MPPEAPPRTVRIAAAVTVLEALVGLGFAVALLVRAASVKGGGVGSLDEWETYGEAGYYTVLAAAVLVAGIALWRGKLWGRTPAILLQLLLLGAAWYAIGPSSRPLVGYVNALPAVLVLWLLFNREGRRWWFAAGAAPDADRES